MQIRAELIHHNIRLYPFDTEETDDEEIQVNAQIRVRETLFVSWRGHVTEAYVTGNDSFRSRRLGTYGGD